MNPSPLAQAKYKLGLYNPALIHARRVLDKAGIKHTIAARLPKEKVLDKADTKHTKLPKEKVLDKADTKHTKLPKEKV